MNFSSKFFFICIVCVMRFAFAQTVYRTPSGGKYHTAQCRYVKNVSHQLSVPKAIAIGLTACKQCNPSFPKFSNNGVPNSGLGIRTNEAKGSSFSVQCRGLTKAGVRCKHKTRNKNGYCHQHETY